MPMNPRLLRPLARQAGALPPSFPSTGLLAFWKLADVTDSSGNGKTLTNTNSVEFVAGKIGNAAEFNGTNYLSRSMAIDFPAGATVSLWCKPQFDSGYGIMFYAGNGTIAINYAGNDSIDINNALVAFQNVSASAGQWHHVVVTFDSGNTQVWLNGVMEGQGDSASTANASNVELGVANGGSNYVGLLDSVGVWSRALTESEIAMLYNAGNGREP